MKQRMKIQTNKFFFFFFFFIYCCIASNSVHVHAIHEIPALLSIKSTLIDPLNRLNDWKLPEKGITNGSIHCNWTGIICNSNGEVQELNLSYKNLSGRISDDIQMLQSLTMFNISFNEFDSKLPDSISKLVHLQSFDVGQNNFNGDFPKGFGEMLGLKILNASSNSFSGFLPEDLGKSEFLETLDFRGSFFIGSIPISYRNLQKLKFLGLSGNNLTGLIPKELGELSSVERIILGYNEFSGEIPVEFGNLSNLRYLDLAVGNLGGRIPAELGKLKLLNTIFLYKNQLVGEIPFQLGDMSSLMFLDFSENKLSGSIPFQFSFLKNLHLLNLMSNRLSGSVPVGIGELRELEVLELWNNSLTGSLPMNLGRNSSLQWLDVSTNSLSGEIPPGLCDQRNLIKLILFNNGFSGSIPIGLSSCSSLVRVRMQNNFFSGSIPAGFGKLEKLQRLELANNSLTGKLPSDIPLSKSISFIDFSRNRLRFWFPSMILSIPSLQTFMASHNNFEGEIPSQFQDSPVLTVVDLSSNLLSGAIPSSIASCGKMVTLILRNNRLTGEIPRSIATMSTLAMLDLSNNSLTGTIPENLGSSPALEMLNLSYNKLEGPIPVTGMLRSINVGDITGNAGLCGGVLPPCSHSSALNSSAERKIHFKHVITGWVIGVSTVVALCIVFFAARWSCAKWKSGNGWFEERFNNGTGEWPWRFVAFQRFSFSSSDLLNCVKESNKIGMGSTGVVYKAEIQRSKTVLAVKKLWRSTADIEMGTSCEDLVGEVNLLGRLRHRNIVRLLGYLHNDNDMMIVYEYMQNGSLGEALHGKQAAKLLVDWVSRYNIAVGVAHGLTYLHHDCNPPVIHRDIKSNNILLDDNLDARIADFGLARMMLRKNETVSMVAGSYGYIAPEYGYTLKVDEKSDIYSYGVVLMELLTGKWPVDPEFGEAVNIVEWVRKKIRNNHTLDEALDPNVGGQCKHIQEEMLLVLRIALLCTAKLPKDRPSMRDVITMLGEAKPRRKSSSNKEKPIFSPSPVIDLL